MIRAVRDGDTETVRKLLSTADAQSLKNDLNGNGATPLYVAAYNGHASVTRQLIEDHCNLYLQRNDGCMPLFVAAQEGHASIMKQLIEARCNMDLPDEDGFTPMHIAAQEGHASVTKVLIDARCDV